MKCPKCSLEQADASFECARCGIIFSKWKARDTAASHIPSPNPMPVSGQGAAMAMAARQNRGGAAAIALPRPTGPVGFFDDIPCPRCGLTTTAQTNNTLQQGSQQALGLVGVLLVMAFASKRHCPDHGEIESSEFPAAHRSNIMGRRILTLLGAVLLFVVCIAILVAIN